MAGQKRVRDEGSSTHKSKKTKLGDGEPIQKISQEQPSVPVSKLVSDEVDFPRGGGTTFTPLEVKTIRSEAVKEANKELFQDSEKKTKRTKRKSDVHGKTNGESKDNSDKIRVEHLNYKRLTVGMRILGQIISVQPLALIVSLPNQLFAHVPITQISPQLTTALEALDREDEDSLDEEDEAENASTKPRVPDLFEIFHPGQYIRAVVTAVHASGSTDASAVGRSRDHTIKASRRVELSLVPERVNAGVQKADLQSGFTLPAAVKSVEDHGYILDFGLPDVSGFLSFKESRKGSSNPDLKFYVGQLLDVCVTKMSGNGRTCTVSIDPELLESSSISEVSNVTSILPGALVQSLIVSVSPNGLNIQLLGYFEGTIDQSHLPSERQYKVGQKVKCRVLYDIAGTTPPRFSLALVDHILKLQIRRFKAKDRTKTMPSIVDAYPVGKILDDVKVTRVETELGLVVEVQPGVEGFVHISHVSDEHVPSLPSSSGAWRIGSAHKARVTGYFHFDGVLQLSLRPSILEQKILQVADVRVGEIIKCTIKKLADTGLFVSISENVDGVVWPNHYADIVLKQPAKRFKTDGTVKCRVLSVDPERNRVALTAKKSLVESKLPILSHFEDARVGMVAHAVVFKVGDKHLVVEFYNHLKAIVPSRETDDVSVGALSTAFPVGKVVKVRIISTDPETGRLTASIRQAASTFQPTVTDISGIEIGNIVAGVVTQIHKDNVVLTLQPTEVRALLSLNNLANHRGSTLPQLRAALQVGESLDNLVVVSRSPEKGFVIVANKPKAKVAQGPKAAVSIDTVEIGQIVGGRVTRHARNGAHVKITPQIGGSLHPTDASDNYEAGVPFPGVDSILKAAVVGIDREKKLLSLSTRHSRLYPEQDKPVADREIKGIADLKVGETIRGFIKSVAEHGVFVTIGRDVDARVQIKELFDEYVKDWKSRFKANQLVKGRIMSVDVEKRKVEMTFRSGDLSRDSSAGLSIADLHEGQKLDGRVKKIEDYGIFIEIEGSKLSGLCHKSQLSDNKNVDVTLALRTFREGDRVKTVVLSINKSKKQLSLGLKPSYFTGEDVNSGSDDSDVDEPQTFGVVDEDEMEQDEDEADTSANNMLQDETIDEDDEDDEDAMDVDDAQLGQASAPLSRSKPALAPSLSLQGGFQWSGTGAQSDAEGSSETSSDESNDGEQTSKKKRRKRKEIEHDLTADMHTKTPESNADFERLLLGSPNSSFLWVQYMSFQLQISEVDKAREIGKRALQTINFREEQEKLNVWIALLNLENVYGTEESLESVFKDAARHNDSKTIHLRLATIFDQTEKYERAEEQYKRTCKKFGQSSKVWTLFGEHYLRRGQHEDARKLLPRCLQSLDKRKHLKTISKFAQLEYKLGDPERGKTIFEGIVDSHPKRWDLWSIYMDMEAGQSDIQSLRNLFDRVLAIKMTSHKAKSFFKKWLDLERRLGDEAGASAVKEKAIEWTQRAAGTS
ncbi:hypothetical protein PLICRDRAFT_122174 [Plicaturopsis crispa FD-325 SS-3]|nr:hypothetical protein PLICRDRAFT_122174 [Plicaturopsis crispa FD-325 SS-3]